jgi:hypothetical protein
MLKLLQPILRHVFTDISSARLSELVAVAL